MMASKHVEYMRQAMKLARYALDHGETPVACVFVHIPSDKVIAYGLNDTNKSHTGIAHAEFMGIQQIQDQFGAENVTDILKDTVLYVTVEPCIMCASALKQVGIQKVFFGCGNERFGGNGTVLRINQDKSTISPNDKNSYESIPGIYRREAIALLRYFYVKQNDHAPKPRDKAERNLDKETFPDIVWSNYVERNIFGQEFGSDFLKHYDNNTDISEDRVDWTLVDNSYDNIIHELNHERVNTKIMLNKKLKINDNLQ